MTRTRERRFRARAALWTRAGARCVTGAGVLVDIPSFHACALRAGGNQRDTDRLRAQQRAAKNAGGKSTLKTAESDAEKLRAKQAAAEAKKAAEAANKTDKNAGGGVVKQKFDIKYLPLGYCPALHSCLPLPRGGTRKCSKCDSPLVDWWSDHASAATRSARPPRKSAHTKQALSERFKVTRLLVRPG
eukprot:CAMPEP_0206032932 /NCGR_PEP_ID=MMETSP1466-20131121/310_1 /ASSEMBLY_ACC=CAM_ASM_001126 /TAXON_ID=44452 /ORGANISM="Pavlova gyrans, Strain CCMP608" /LENGTH=187 /DNA_ID=CAMNT_0053407093 /DNA_START=27 /DNA_END=588 /DNA_ORIENTATION=-